MPEAMSIHDAAAVLRGQGITTKAEQRRAAARVLHELEQVFLLRVWARRVLDAPDEAAAAVARRGLETVLGGS